MKSDVEYASSALLGNEMAFIKLKKKEKIDFDIWFVQI